MFAVLLMVLAGSSVALGETWPQPHMEGAGAVRFPVDLRNSYAKVVQEVKKFEDRQAHMHARVVSDAELQDMLSGIDLDAQNGNFTAARADIGALQTALDNWNLELSGGTRIGGEETGTVFLPILIYHYTPPNFDEQLTYLEQHGYTVVDLDQAVAGLRGGPLPAKPVVITFDDGFANQMQAFELLQKHNMKATFYILNGGEESKWCIGAGRQYGLPVQPPGGCGDAYLSWDQVRMLDRAGMTIGGHTLDHENLAGLPPEQQRRQIVDSKVQIEQELGHPIYHFAYPYGAYNDTTIELVKEAGYNSAVSTLPGDYQSPSFQYTLRRVRDALQLP